MEPIMDPAPNAWNTWCIERAGLDSQRRQNACTVRNAVNRLKQSSRSKEFRPVLTDSLSRSESDFFVRQ